MRILLARGEVFDPEIEKIKDPSIRTLVRLALDEVAKANDYFYKGHASTSGKYHPTCCNVKGGIIRHSKRAVDIGIHLSTAYGFDSRQTDICIAALILHDTWKNNYRTHADRAAKMLVALLGENQELLDEIGRDALKIVTSIRFHMGRWTEKSYAKPIQEYTPEELVVYFADYLASRPDIGTGQDSCELSAQEELRKAV